MGESFCVNHASVAAVATCSRCGCGVCEVCRFDFGALMLCPACATAGPTDAERSRVVSAGFISVSLAIVGFALIAVFMILGASGSPANGPLASLGGVLLLGCSLGGVGVGLVAREEARRTGSMLPTIGIITGGVLLAVTVVLSILGNMK